MSSRKETKYNAIIGESGGAVYVLNDIFSYGDGFKGATGYTMRPVFQDYVDSMNDPETVAEYYSDIWREQVASGMTEESLADFCESVVRDCEFEGRLHPLDDPSYRADFEQALEQATPEIQEKVREIGGDCIAWEVESCGRCLKDIDTVWRADLMREIEKVEK